MHIKIKRSQLHKPIGIERVPSTTKFKLSNFVVEHAIAIFEYAIMIFKHAIVPLKYEIRNGMLVLSFNMKL